MPKYAFFLGCVMPLRYAGIESSTRAVMKELGVELVDVDEFSCCPAPGIMRSLHSTTWLAIAAHNLVAAQEKGLDIMVVCNGCFGSLDEASHILNHDEAKRAEVNKVLAKAGSKEYKGKTRVRHFAEVLHKEVGVEAIQRKVKKPLDLDVAVHYGCHFLKPSAVRALDNPEAPTLLDELVVATGARSVNYRQKQMCCGAGGGVRANTPDVALKMTTEKLNYLDEVKVDLILDVCPFCHLQYDRGQKDLARPKQYPVVHLSQFYGMAFGIDPRLLGFGMHDTKVDLKV
jgi:heterodisulfide reductase subunit B